MEQATIGNIHIIRSANNTKIRVIDREGNILAQRSALSKGIKGGRRATRRAVQVTAEDIADSIVNQGVRRVNILDKGLRPGGGTAASAFEARGIQVQSVVAASAFSGSGSPFAPGGQLHGSMEYFPASNQLYKLLTINDRKRCYCCDPENEKPHIVWPPQANARSGKAFCPVHDEVRMTSTTRCKEPLPKGCEELEEDTGDRT